MSYKLDFIRTHGTNGMSPNSLRELFVELLKYTDSLEKRISVLELQKRIEDLTLEERIDKMLNG